jgi:hypothetical protein
LQAVLLVVLTVPAPLGIPTQLKQAALVVRVMEVAGQPHVVPVITLGKRQSQVPFNRTGSHFHVNVVLHLQAVVLAGAPGPLGMTQLKHLLLTKMAIVVLQLHLGILPVEMKT